jgi:hypothetical protein
VSDELLVRYASPTLAALKVGSLISYRSGDTQSVQEQVDAWNELLNDRGVVVQLLSSKNDLHLMYVHRPQLLDEKLKEQDVQTVLCPLGYPIGSCPHLLLHLQTRLENQEETFPHEIGLFLGYPTEDVKAFIQNQGCKGLCDGCWKVYGDVEKAKRIFAHYKKCTKLYLKLHQNGRSLEQLTVRRKAL